ncbi:hypothetical protein HanRHA438_Chr16g0762911 [Helianthus annuus]|nr:hypothetical protein HanRHA438_Chr16g0762911 [Helianthus annuus]
MMLLSLISMIVKRPKFILNTNNYYNIRIVNGLPSLAANDIQVPNEVHLNPDMTTFCKLRQQLPVPCVVANVARII